MQVAGLQDFRQEGPPGDIGVFQGTASVVVYKFTFSGVTYYVAQRMGVRGWALVDQGTVAATVINAAATAARALGVDRPTILFKEGAFSGINATLDLTGLNVVMLGYIYVPDAFHGIAVRCGSPAANTSMALNLVLRVRRTDQSVTAGDIGIHLQGITAGNVIIMESTYFYTGIQIESTDIDGAYSYTPMFLGDISFNSHSGLQFTASGTGWVNENEFFGGNFGGVSLYAIDFGSGNNNVFHKPSFQNAGVGTRGIYMTHGFMNHFYDCRLEGPERIAEFSGDASYNIVEIGYWNNSNGEESPVDQVAGMFNRVIFPTGGDLSIPNPMDIDKQLKFFDDFQGSGLNTFTWRKAVTDSGDSYMQGALNGIYRQETGATNGSTVILDQNNYPITIYYKHPRFKARVAPLNVTKATYKVYLFTDATHYVGFDAVNGVAAGNWMANCNNGGGASLTQTDTGIACAVAAFDLEVWIRANAIVEFRINGKLVATITTNVPTGEMWPYIYTTNTEAVTKKLDIDYISVEQKR